MCSNQLFKHCNHLISASVVFHETPSFLMCCVWAPGTMKGTCLGALQEGLGLEGTLISGIPYEFLETHFFPISFKISL